MNLGAEKFRGDIRHIIGTTVSYTKQFILCTFRIIAVFRSAFIENVMQGTGREVMKSNNLHSQNVWMTNKRI